MVFTSVIGELGPVPLGNAVAGFWESPIFNDPTVESRNVYTYSESEEKITYGQYRRFVPRAAAFFETQYRIKQNDVVLIFGTNHLYLPAIHHGAISLGAIISPANVMYNSEELAHQLKMAKPKLLIVLDSIKNTAVEGAKLAGLSGHTIVTYSQLFKEFSELLNAAEAPERQPIPLDGKTSHAYYCFSSGTSGVPKGVITTHYNMIANVIQHYSSFSVATGAGKHFGMVLPMSHIYGLNSGIWAGAYTGTTICIFPKFDLESLVSITCKRKLTALFLVPPIVLALGKLPILDKYPEFNECVEYVLSGAAPISKKTIGLLKAKCPKVHVVQGYGLTETTPLTHSGLPVPQDVYDTDSIGWLVPGAEAQLVDFETGKVVTEHGKPGELWLRGPMVMAGYLHNKEATDAALTPDRWFKTGDVAVVDKDHQFYIVDRIKELIKSNGHQVAPAELESILLSNPNVADAAVVGVYNEHKTSEMPRAYLVIKEGADLKSIISWFNKQVAKHKRLWGGAVVIPEIPKSASGKILRKDLREKAPSDHAIAVGQELAAL